MKNLINIFFLGILLLTLAGCDLFKKDVVKKALDSSQFQLPCTLDVDQFANMFSENISSQLRCLGESLNLFIRSVDTDRPGYMNRAALEAYLKNNRDDIGPDVIRALRAIYDLNYLVTGEDREYISKKNVDELIEFAILLNSEMAVTISPLFSSKRKISVSVHDAQRKFVKNSALKLVAGLSKIFNHNPGSGNRELSLGKLLKSFATDATMGDIDKVIKVLFVKKVLFGGDKDILTYDQVNRHVLSNFGQIAESIFDIVKFQYVKDFTQEKIFDLLERNVKLLSDIITNPNLGNRDRELFFTVDEAMEVAELFITGDDFKVEDWKTLVIEAKRVFMGGDDKSVLGLDFKTLVGHANNIFKTGTVFYSIYKNPKLLPILEDPRPVTIDFNEFKHTYYENLEELNHFERIVKKYRFFRGKFESAYYTKGIRRNSDGIVEVYMYEYLLRTVMKVHGHPNTSSLGGYGITQIELGNLVTKLEKELIRLKLIMPLKKDAMIDNISLLGTLFQYQSDKNGVLDANEATEFLIVLLSAMDMSSNMTDYYKMKGCAFDKFDRVEPNCFKQNFFQSFCASFEDGKPGYRDGYRKFFPLMFESMGASSCEEMENSEANQSFLDVSIRAARSCNNYDNEDGTLGEEIYFSDGDIYSTIIVMMHAEATTLRWDDVYNKGNGNNLMDAPEVDRAYEIYSPALDGFLEGKSPIIKGLKKQIYQYLIKYETVPDEKEFKSIWKFIKFLVSFNKKAPAYRRTLASILNEIGKQNAITAASQGKPKFQCNWLKDPDNIPQEIPTGSISITPERDFSGLLSYVYRSGDVDQQGEPVFRNDKELCVMLFNKNICL